MLAHGSRITGDELLFIAIAIAFVCLIMPLWVRRILHRPSTDRSEHADREGP